MEETSSTTASTGPRRDNALLNQSLDDIIKQNREKRRGEKKKPAQLQKNKSNGNRRGDRNDRRRPMPRDRDNKMMDTTPVSKKGGVKKVQSGRNNDKRDNRRGGKVIIRSDSGRPRRNNAPSSSSAGVGVVAKSTPGLRQPWEKLPTAPIPAEPLKISIRNELADRPVRRSDAMMDTDGPVSRPGMSSYEPRDSLATRDEYRIGNRFSTQGMAIDYQLPSGASYDTRPTRRY